MKRWLMSLVCCAVVMLPSLAFAQESTSVKFEPLVEFDNMFTTITTQVGPLVAAALTLGLAIWGTRYIFRIVKSMGR